MDVIEDAALLLAAGTPDGWGVAVVAGTGSMAFARGADGRTARAGGWGPLLGDEGSGYAIALAGLRAAARAADGRAAATPLTDRLLAAFGLTRPEELIGVVYRGGDRAALAALAPVVLEAADAGDAVAAEIASRRPLPNSPPRPPPRPGQLGLGAAFPVALAGGLLASSHDLPRPVPRRPRRARTSPPIRSPSSPNPPKGPSGWHSHSSHPPHRSHPS